MVITLFSILFFFHFLLWDERLQFRWNCVCAYSLCEYCIHFWVLDIPFYSVAFSKMTSILLQYCFYPSANLVKLSSTKPHDFHFNLNITQSRWSAFSYIQGVFAFFSFLSSIASQCSRNSTCSDESRCFMQSKQIVAVGCAEKNLCSNKIGLILSFYSYLFLSHFLSLSLFHSLCPHWNIRHFQLCAHGKYAPSIWFGMAGILSRIAIHVTHSKMTAFRIHVLNNIVRAWCCSSKPKARNGLAPPNTEYHISIWFGMGTAKREKYKKE